MAALTATLTPHLTNEVRGSWLRDKLQFESAIPQAQLGLNLPLRLDPRLGGSLIRMRRAGDGRRGNSACGSGRII